MVTAEDCAPRPEQIERRFHPWFSLLERPRHPEDTFDRRNPDTDVFARAQARKALSPAPEFKFVCPNRPSHKYNREPNAGIEPNGSE